METPNLKRLGGIHSHFRKTGMRLELVIYILGWLLVFFSASMLPSLGIAVWYGTGGGVAILSSIFLTFGVGAAMLLNKRIDSEADISPREGFLIVSGVWFLCSGFGALPFFIAETFAPDTPLSLHSIFASYTDSFFESASGLTTTGASVLSDFDQPHAIMFWRSTTHWLGGMGIIVLSLAILPLIGAGGMQLFKAEAPGPVQDRLKPRIADTAITLSKVYVLLTAVETLALWFCGMSWYEALAHTFGTVATGGFSTMPYSVGDYNSASINGIVTFFMMVAGANFALHYRFLKGEYWVYFKSGEFRVYLATIVVSTLTIALLVSHSGLIEGIGKTTEHSLFQVVSIMTTTGFCTIDFELWPDMACMLLFFLMFVGGCAGSTGGGIKVIRLILLAKIAYREIYRLLYPTAVVIIKQDGEPVPDRVLSGIAGFFILVSAVFVFSSLLLSAFGLDFLTSMSATAACLFNVGPGFGLVGAYDNYAALPHLVKWWLSFCMIVGRLEFYSVLILLAPSFWRR